MVHGVRHDPFVGIYPSMSDEQIAAKLWDIAEPVVIAAHTHWPIASRRWRADGDESWQCRDAL